MLKGCKWVGIPFAGGMPELLYIDAPTIVVGDLHRHVINLAQCLQHYKFGPSLYRSLKRQLFDPDTLARSQHWCKTHDSRPSEIPDIDAAFYFFISQWMGRSGNAGTDKEFQGRLPVRWNASGGDSNTRYRSAVKSIAAWRRILQWCNFVVQDCFEFLSHVQDQEGHGVYCDPPFPGPGERYKHTFTEEQHCRLARELACFKHARIVCRFYDHPLIRTIYPDDVWTWNHFIGRKQSNADAPEVLLSLNYEKGLF